MNEAIAYDRQGRSKVRSRVPLLLAVGLSLPAPSRNMVIVPATRMSLIDLTVRQIDRRQCVWTLLQRQFRTSISRPPFLLPNLSNLERSTSTL